MSSLIPESILLQLPFYVSCLSLSAAYWICWVVYARTVHPLAKVPGPWLASITRLWICQQTFNGNFDSVQMELHKKYGPLVRIAPNEVVCTQPEAIKKIYPIQSPLEKSDFYSTFAINAFSKHPDLFSCTNERVHGQRRKIVNHVYSLTNVLRSEEYIDKCSHLFIERLGEFADSGQTLSLSEWAQMYTFDVMGEIFFGRMFGLLQERGDPNSYIRSIRTTTELLFLAAVAPSYTRPLLLGATFLHPAVRRRAKALKHMTLTAKACVKQRRLELENDEGTPRQDFLQQLFDTARDKGEKLDFGIEEIHQESYLAILAGSETTSTLLCATLYYLMKNPQVYDELMSKLIDAATSGELSTPAKYAETVKIPLLIACIKEAARLNPPVAATMPRVSPSDGMELCDKYIPQGYYLGMNPIIVQRDQSIFGEDADLYRPSRWLEQDSTIMEKHMLHFGAGTRTCIGKNLSIAEIYKIVPDILLHFKLELVGNQGWRTKTLFSQLLEDKSLEVRLTRRN